MGFGMGRDYLSPYFFWEVVSDGIWLPPVNGALPVFFPVHGEERGDEKSV
jgi:hypothetical protein